MATLTIGADPEFGLLNRGHIVHANTVIAGENDNAKFGVDGCQRIAEIRPKYQTCPRDLVKEIQKVLQGGLNKYPNLAEFKWKSGGMVGEEPLGGHVHFGNSALSGDQSLQQRVNAMLNRTLAPLILMLEDKDEAVDRRLGSGYGQIRENSYRPQPWGVEWRVLPSWLTSPKEAESILSACFIVASGYDDESFSSEVLSLPEFPEEVFQECDKVTIAYYLKDIILTMKKAPLFSEYKNEVRSLFGMLVNGELLSYDSDMKATWDLKVKAPRETVEA